MAAVSMFVPYMRTDSREFQIQRQIKLTATTYL